MKVMVTGGAGFIGSHIVEELLKRKYKVIVVDNLVTGKREYVPEEAKFYEVDIRTEALGQIFEVEKPDYVIHQAAQVSVTSSIQDPAYDCDQNIMSTVKLLSLAAQHRVKKLVFASTAAVYGKPVKLPVKEEHPLKPVSFYGLSKKACEEYIKAFHQLSGLTYTILRYSNVFGGRQDSKGEAGVVSIFSEKLKANQPITIYGDGEQTRDFIYVKDVACANVQALTHADNQILNVSSGHAITINELVYLLKKSAAEERGDLHFPKVLHEEKRKGDIDHSTLSNEQTKKELCWKPETSMVDGLKETYFYQGQALTSQVS